MSDRKITIWCNVYRDKKGDYYIIPHRSRKIAVAFRCSDCLRTVRFAEMEKESN